MENEIVARLLALNARFYADCSGSFSATRQRIQPGVERSLSGWVAKHGGFEASAGLRLLDLGCGNGNLAVWLESQGYLGWYTGVDQSKGLLEQVAAPTDRYTCLEGDLTKPDWLEGLPAHPFDLVTCYAVLHHIPGEYLRLRLLREIKRLLAPNGGLSLSCWQIDHSPRLLKRIQAWEKVGLTPADVEAGDVLMDWRADDEYPGEALRYVHTFNEMELAHLAAKSSFQLDSSWLSDGKEGNLGLYQLWSRA